MARPAAERRPPPPSAPVSRRGMPECAEQSRSCSPNRPATGCRRFPTSGSSAGRWPSTDFSNPITSSVAERTIDAQPFRRRRISLGANAQLRPSASRERKIATTTISILWSGNWVPSYRCDSPETRRAPRRAPSGTAPIERALSEETQAAASGRLGTRLRSSLETCQKQPTP